MFTSIIYSGKIVSIVRLCRGASLANYNNRMSNCEITNTQLLHFGMDVSCLPVDYIVTVANWRQGRMREMALKVNGMSPYIRTKLKMRGAIV